MHERDAFGNPSDTCSITAMRTEEWLGREVQFLKVRLLYPTSSHCLGVTFLPRRMAPLCFRKTGWSTRTRTVLYRDVEEGNTGRLLGCNIGDWGG